jgi:predicted GNAT family N-acyltransferase
VTDQYRALPLLDQHRTPYFLCRHAPHLDKWLQKRALADQHLGKSATHVWVDDEDIVVAYFTLLQTTIREQDDAPFFLDRILPKGWPRTTHELPGILIGKLALDESLQGQELGLDLIADAYFVACEAVMLIGGAVLVVDPMNEKVAGLYNEFGFNAVDGSDRMVLNFREFNKGTAID